MANPSSIRTAAHYKYDQVSLGEVMMRIDPGDVPTPRARTARIWHGGGETNVAEGLAYSFGFRTAVVTALVDDGIGRNIECQLKEAGVDTSNIIWFSPSGEGRFSTDGKGTLHNGINFTWRGKGVLPSVTEYYRAYTPSSVLKPGDVDWEGLFSQGVRWFTTGGIFSCIGPRTAEIALEALQVAGKHGVLRSYDLNYRSKLQPDRETAWANNRRIIPHVDFLTGNFFEALGYEVRTVGRDEPMEASMDAFADMLREVAADYPNLKLIGTPIRRAFSADLITWGAVLYDVVENTMHRAAIREHVEIADRTGGGDAFCCGVIGSLMLGKTTGEAVEYGAAHGIIAQEFPGDATMASLSMIEKEIKRAKTGGGVSAIR